MKNILLLVLVAGFATGCSTERILKIALNKNKPDHPFNPTGVPPEPDYALAGSWDTVQEQPVYLVDVFFLHPTTYLKPDGWNGPIADSSVLARNRMVRKVQLSAFYGTANLYMPRYRQATLYAFVDPETVGAQALTVAYEDVKRAFLYYLEHYNNGRPFFLAGHSQGSYLGKQLLKDVLQDETIRRRMIAAYLIGMEVTQQDTADFRGLPPCHAPGMTGCFVSYNTQEKGGFSLVRSPKETIAVNPLSWRDDEQYIPSSENLGALIGIGGTFEIIPAFTGARLDKGRLYVDKQFPYKKELNNGPNKGGLHNYHIFDYNFFYENIRENVRAQVAMYQKR
ncbi:MAG: DUF3089 domain-containing protein [Saprospiraceae bacterium]|nr:DUF3089 domain-containing protein [Saprospiraceae bacterium]